MLIVNKPVPKNPVCNECNYRHAISTACYQAAKFRWEVETGLDFYSYAPLSDERINTQHQFIFDQCIGIIKEANDGN